MTVPQATPSEPISTIETKQETLSIVVPAYNEELVIAEFHRRISAVLDEINLPVEIIYINDGSSDATAQVLAKAQKNLPHFQRLHHSTAKWNCLRLLSTGPLL